MASGNVVLVSWFIVAALYFFGAELLSIIALNVWPIASLVYTVPQATEAEFREYLGSRDPILGWPGRGWLAHNTSDDGARISPANKRLEDKSLCMSVYGDSFAYSEEVDHEHAWANLLAEKLGCRILNFGVGGYGTDQALLRFESHLDSGRDIGNTILVTVYPDDLNRIVNQWRYLLSGSKFGFKPTFRKSGDSFRFVPIAVSDYGTFRKVAKYPEDHLTADFFSPANQFFKSKIRVGFPYSLVLIRVFARMLSSLNEERIGKPIRFLNLPGWYDTRGGMAPRKRETFAYILRRYSRKCLKHKLRCVVATIPDSEMLMALAGSGRHGLERISSLVPDGLLYVDITQCLYSKFGDDFCLYYTKPHSCTGHFNENGYKAVAECIGEGVGWLSEE